jgi:hypothetical protein
MSALLSAHKVFEMRQQHSQIPTTLIFFFKTASESEHSWRVRKYVGVLILAFPVSYFLICSTTKIIFLGWVKEVRTTKS